MQIETSNDSEYKIHKFTEDKKQNNRSSVALVSQKAHSAILPMNDEKILAQHWFDYSN